KVALREFRVEQADVAECGQMKPVLSRCEEVVGDLPFETAVTRVATVLVHGLDGRDDDRLDAILEVDPEQARIVEQAGDRRPVNARLPRQRFRCSGNSARTDVRKWRCDVEEANRPIALADAEIGLILTAEVEA